MSSSATELMTMVKRIQHGKPIEKPTAEEIEAAKIQKKLARMERVLKYRREYQARYSALNPEKVKEYRKRYYESNKDKYCNPEKYNEYYRTKSAVIHECPCGSTINGASIYQHVKSKKHIAFVQNNPDVDIYYMNK